jgi:hypothetical protein
MFGSWSYGYPQSFTLPANPPYPTYTAYYITEYLLTEYIMNGSALCSVNCWGYITPGQGWYTTQTAYVSAAPNPGYQFVGFSGSLSGTQPQTVTLPASITAQFIQPDTPAMSLTKGPPQMGVILTGGDFVGSQSNQGSVKLGTQPMNVISWSASSVTVQVPAAATGSVVLTPASGTGGATIGFGTFTVTDGFGCGAQVGN